MASSQEPAEPAAMPATPATPDSPGAAVPDAEGLVATPRPRLPVEVAARLAAWEEQDEARRTREHQEAVAVAEAAEAARVARGSQRRAPGGQKSCASITSASKHHSGDKSRPDPNRPRVQTERFRLRHGASAEEMMRDYRRLVTYPRQCPVLKAQLVLRSRPLALEHGQTVNSRYRQAAAEYQHTTLSTSAKGEVIVVSTAPAVADFRNPPKQGPSKLPPPKWDRWLASRHPPDREDAALVPTPVHLPPLPGEASGTSVWAAIGARDSWTSFKMDSPPPVRTPSARSARPQTSPRDQPQPSPASQPQPYWQSVRPSPASQSQPWWLSARPSPPQPARTSPPQPHSQSGRPSPPPLVRVPPPPPPAARVVSTRLDLESCLSVVSLQAPYIAPAYRPRPQVPPPRRFEMVRNYSTGDSPAAGLTVTPVLQPARPPAGRQRRSPPPRPPEPTLSEPTSLSTWPASSLSARSSLSAPNSPRTIPHQTRR